MKLVEEVQLKAVKGDVEAQLELLRMYHYGKNGVKTSLPLAIHWGLKAADAGSAEAGYHLGYLYLKSGVFRDDARSLAWFNRSAEMGYAPAQNFLGSKYSSWNGPKPNPVLSASWYRKSAEQGNPVGMFEYGAVLKRGLGVPMDLKASFEWYVKSAETPNSSFAQHEVAVAYFDGIGTSKDDVKSLAYVQLACGWDEAYYNHSCGEISVSEGRRIKAILEARMSPAAKESAKALSAEIKSRIDALGAKDPAMIAQALAERKGVMEFEATLVQAEKGDVFAQHILSSLYRGGHWTIISDTEKANHWLKKSATGGNGNAQSELGLRLQEFQDGFERDYVESAKWLRKAAEQLHPQGLFELGLCYEIGRGVDRDELEAFAFYVIALGEFENDQDYRAKVAYFEARMSPDARKSGLLRAAKLKAEIEAKMAADKTKAVGK